MATVMDQLDDLEIGLCCRVNRLGRRLWLRRIFIVVSKLGDWSFWVALGLVAILRQEQNAVAIALHLGLTAAAGVLVYKLLKRTLVRERPFINSGSILCGTAPLDRYSFPSGHTLHAVCFTIMLANIEPSLLMLCAPFAALVATSRVVLGLHYPSDVLVGAILGTSLATTSLSLM